MNSSFSCEHCPEENNIWFQKLFNVKNFCRKNSFLVKTITIFHNNELNSYVDGRLKINVFIKMWFCIQIKKVIVVVKFWEFIYLSTCVQDWMQNPTKLGLGHLFSITKMEMVHCLCGCKACSRLTECGKNAKTWVSTNWNIVGGLNSNSVPALWHFSPSFPLPLLNKAYHCLNQNTPDTKTIEVITWPFALIGVTRWDDSVYN